MAKSTYKLLGTIKSTPADQIHSMRIIAMLENLFGDKELAKRDFNSLSNLFTAYPRIPESWVSFPVAAAYYRAQGDERGFLRLKDRAIKATLSKKSRASIFALYLKPLVTALFRLRNFLKHLFFMKRHYSIHRI